ncbi:MAG: hypothetical protein LH632_12725 [Rhodoferax sp.]|nr:hypothetical protein [Rhodoferax sp.]
MKIISWNIRHRTDIWQSVVDLNADVALLQEACEPPMELASRLDHEPDPWCTEGTAKRQWRTSVVGIRRGIRIERMTPRPLAEASPGDLAISRKGTFSVARVENPTTSETITLISMYSVWENRHRDAEGDKIFADASAHRLISDISSLVARERGHRIVAAGDLNCLYGYGEQGREYWKARYATIFARFAAIGLPFVGPQHPNGRQASPWPKELPGESRNVPTYYTAQQKMPERATRQLDFVFASPDLASRVDVRAMNEASEWGPSDHCRIEITIRDA